MSKAGLTKREKILAGIVLGSLTVVGLIFAINRVTSAFDSKQDELVRLDGTIGKQKTTIKRGKAAEQQIAAWRERSLPEDTTRARSLYLNWLRKRAVEAKLDGVKINTQAAGREGDVYFRHGFGLDARGTLPQLVKLLFDFYSVDQLHRITRLNVKPINNSKQLDIDLAIEAIAIPGAPDRDALPEPGSSDRLARQDLVQYVRAIMNRSLFSPANRPPKVDLLATQRAYADQELRFSIPASDPESEGLVFELGPNIPGGMRIDPDRGEVTWLATKNWVSDRTYNIVYKVTDKGWPAKSVSGTFKLNVVEAPPQAAPKIGFDPATLATVSGITRTSLGPVVWINVKTEGKVLRLRAGDNVSVGTIRGKVSKVVVEDKFAEFELSDGRVITVSLGRTLAGSNSTDLGGI